MTEEHILAEWMHPHLPKVNDPKKQTARLVVRKDGVVEKKDPKAQQGHTYTYRIKAVCKQCNSGWMSGTETSISQTLMPLLTGQNTILTVEGQAKLAFWLAMKALVIECDRPSDTALSQDVRDNFYRNHTIPQEMEIWISAHNIAEYYGYFWHRSLKVKLEEQSFSAGCLKNVQTTILCAGRFFGFIFFNTVPGISFLPKRSVAEKLLRIWPIVGGDILWPPVELNMTEAEELANVIIDVMRAIPEWS